VRILNKCLNREVGAKAGLAQSLVAHLKHCAIGLVKPSNQREGLTHQTDSLPGSSGTDAKQRLKIDKSLLTLSEPKRLRSKDHLRFVAHQPCLICGRRPSQAHHVRYAQPRGLRLKVSDEFTVPLCAIHHTENHTTGMKGVGGKSVRLIRCRSRSSCGGRATESNSRPRLATTRIQLANRKEILKATA
jgi:hypothetical protein